MESRARPSLGRRPPPFWLRPGTALAIVFFATMLLFTATSEADLYTIFRAPKVDTLAMWGYGAWAFGWLAAGIAVVYLTYPRRLLQSDQARPNSDYEVMSFIGYISLALAAGAYAVFYLNAGLSLQDLRDGFSGEVGASYTLEKQLVNIPGVTSLMNVAPWWYAFVGYKLFIAKRRLSRLELLMSGLLFAAVCFRAFAAFERRAIFDLAIPVSVLVLICKRDWSLRSLRLINISPLLAIVALAAVFLAGEYFRSWANHYSITGEDYFRWGLTRLSGYYVTAVNNGALAVESGRVTGGRISLAGLYDFPVLGQMLGPPLRSGPLSGFLAQSANPEFNNVGGAIATLVDFGLWGGALFLLAHGVLFAYIYMGAARRHIIFVLLYSLVFFGILEVTRVWFLGGAFGVLNLVYLPLLFGLYRALPRRPRQSDDPILANANASAPTSKGSEDGLTHVLPTRR